MRNKRSFVAGNALVNITFWHSAKGGPVLWVRILATMKRGLFCRAIIDDPRSCAQGAVDYLLETKCRDYALLGVARETLQSSLLEDPMVISTDDEYEEYEEESP